MVVNLGFQGFKSETPLAFKRRRICASLPSRSAQEKLNNWFGTRGAMHCVGSRDSSSSSATHSDCVQSSGFVKARMLRFAEANANYALYVGTEVLTAAVIQSSVSCM
jgi:hypothetical protein